MKSGDIVKVNGSYAMIIAVIPQMDAETLAEATSSYPDVEFETETTISYVDFCSGTVCDADKDTIIEPTEYTTADVWRWIWYWDGMRNDCPEDRENMVFEITPILEKYGLVRDK